MAYDLLSRGIEIATTHYRTRHLGIHMTQPKTTEWRKDQIPTELVDLKNQVEELPLHVRQKMLPLCERLHHYSRLHSRLLRIAQEAVDQLQLDMKYLNFDLEATRRERDELLREMRGFDEEAPN
jgi:hypothetical protein